MADIVAGDVTAKILEVAVLGNPPEGRLGPGKPLIFVMADITIDPGTTDAYPTGGIPLTNLFTTGNASDLKLDTNMTITPMGQFIGKISDADTPIIPVQFKNGGIAAANQTLILGHVGSTGSVNNPRLSYTAATISAALADVSINDSANAFPAFVVGEPILISGFTGTATNNRAALVVSRTVSKIVISASGAAIVDDAAGESVTVTSLWPAAMTFVEHANTDVTLAGDIATGDKDIVVRVALFGRQRPGTTL